MRKREKTIQLAGLLTLVLLAGANPAAACFFGDFSVSTVPSLPEAEMEFELVVDYEVSSVGCTTAEDLVVSAAEVRLDINCHCIFIAPDPAPRQYRTTVPGIPAGLYDFEAIHVDSNPAPRTVGSAQFLIGHAPAIPFSPLTWTLFALALAGAAVWVLRR